MRLVCIFVSMVHFLLIGQVAASVDFEERDPVKDIFNALSSEHSAGWLITGHLDVDGDGDLDMLVAHEYLLGSAGGGEIDHAKFFVYIREKDSYFMSRRIGLVPIYFHNVEFRRLKGTSGHRALIKYETAGGWHDRVFAMWYEKDAEGNLVQRATFFPSSALIDSNEDDIVSAEVPDEWAKRGLSIDKVLKNYRRLSLEEARRVYGVTSPEEPQMSVSGVKSDARDGDAAANYDEKRADNEIAVSDKEESKGAPAHAQKNDDASGSADQGETSILTAVFVSMLGLFGLAAIVILYRRRKAG